MPPATWRRTFGDAESQALLAPWPIPRPRQWRSYVNRPQNEAEVAAIRQSVARGTPYGGDSWVSQAAARLKLKHTLRPRGRPPKK